MRNTACPEPLAWWNCYWPKKGKTVGGTCLGLRIKCPVLFFKAGSLSVSPGMAGTQESTLHLQQCRIKIAVHLVWLNRPLDRNLELKRKS